MVGADLPPIVVRGCGVVRVFMLMEVDVAMRDGMRVRFVRIVNVLLRHDRHEDQTGRKGQRDKRSAEEGTHAEIMGVQPCWRQSHRGGRIQGGGRPGGNASRPAVCGPGGRALCLDRVAARHQAHLTHPPERIKPIARIAMNCQEDMEPATEVGPAIC